jgi:hypothetical protein
VEWQTQFLGSNCKTAMILKFNFKLRGAKPLNLIVIGK